ncbi:MAG: sugar transferase [Sporolactobacillus sp.]
MNAEKQFKFAVGYTAVRTMPSVALPDKAGFYLPVKRMIDIAGAVIGLLVSAPIILLFAVLIICETPGAPFYVQERVGLNGRAFRLIKLRSMRRDAERFGAKWAEANDPRVTRIGRFIRKTRIDELPQFISVLKGDMSLIGPRPERPMFTEKFNEEIPGFKNRLLVKPGLTGLAQVNGGYDLSPKEKLIYDLEYVRHFSPTMELDILFKTIRIVFTGEGAR